MSNIIVNRIRSADLPPTDKFVLWVISDIANDAGFTAAFAPLARLQAETRFSRQTIISAIQRLESQNIIKADRLNGRQRKLFRPIQTIAQMHQNQSTS